MEGEGIISIACSLTKSRPTAQRLFKGLQAEGSYDPVQRWKTGRCGRPAVTQAFVPLGFRRGETCQFDWSHEEVALGGLMQTIALAHFHLPRNRQRLLPV